MAKKKDRIDRLIQQGARYVSPPKKAAETFVAEPESVPEPIPSPAPIEDAADLLSKHWKESIRPDETPTEYAEYQEIEPKIGQICNLVVVSWVLTDPTGYRGGHGLARPQGTKKGQRNGYYFKEADIISVPDAIETLRPGSRIRARLAEAISTAHPFSLKDVEIFND